MRLVEDKKARAWVTERRGEFSGSIWLATPCCQKPEHLIA
jgi:hypothetical protein